MSTLLHQVTSRVIQDIVQASQLQYVVVITTVSPGVVSQTGSYDGDEASVMEHFEERLLEWMGNMVCNLFFVFLYITCPGIHSHLSLKCGHHYAGNLVLGERMSPMEFQGHRSMSFRKHFWTTVLCLFAFNLIIYWTSRSKGKVRGSTLLLVIRILNMIPLVCLLLNFVPLQQLASLSIIIKQLQIDSHSSGSWHGHHWIFI